MTRPSLYEFAGGHDAMLALAVACTERCTRDPELSHAFSQPMSPDHDERLAAYWAEVLGGPARYSESFGGHSAMLEIHAAHGTPDEWGDRFEACFVAAMDDVHLPDDPEFRRALHDYMHWATREVNAYSPSGSKVKPNLRTPRWSWDGLLQET